MRRTTIRRLSSRGCRRTRACGRSKDRSNALIITIIIIIIIRARPEVLTEQWEQAAACLVEVAQGVGLRAEAGEAEEQEGGAAEEGANNLKKLTHLLTC
jgi:hypothetical protein